jgi:transcriptional regulator with XRE-family HTH domain
MKNNKELNSFGYMYLGEKLRHFRDYKHLTLREAALIMGVTPPRFQNLERGADWSVEEMRKFSIFIGKSFDKILEWFEKGKTNYRLEPSLEEQIKEKIGEL